MSPRDTRRDTAGHGAGHECVPTACWLCFGPLQDQPLGTVELIMVPGVVCRACDEAPA